MDVQKDVREGSDTEILCPFCLNFQNDIVNHIYMCNSFTFMEKHNFTNKIDSDVESKLFSNKILCDKILSYADIVKSNIPENYIPKTLLSLMNTKLPHYEKKDWNNDMILNVSLY